MALDAPMINRPQPVAAIRRLAVLLLCLSSLPGCLTRALWQSETELVTRSELLSESSQRSDGRLGLTSSGVVWRGEDGDETWARLDRPGGDLAMAVLARPGLCEVLKATLERMRVTLDAELVEESAHLALVVRLRKIAIGQVVDAEQLTPEVRGLLASGARVCCFVAGSAAGEVCVCRTKPSLGRHLKARRQIDRVERARGARVGNPAHRGASALCRDGAHDLHSVGRLAHVLAHLVAHLEEEGDKVILN